MKIDNQILNQMGLLYENKIDPLTFKFDQLTGPMIYCMLPEQVIMHMYQYAVDPKYSKSLREKINHYDEVLQPFGFRRFAAGTNRAVYRFYENTTICLKVALDKVGIEANQLEFRNQNFLKPFVAKCFNIDRTGVVAIYERVLPIRSRQEFIEVASDIFDVITNRFIGKYVLEDIGTKYFKNWGIREGFGPVLLDYPYAFEIDINGLFCNNMVNGIPVPCGGEIDYDAGYNYLYCMKCGKRHRARDIGKAIESKILRYYADGGYNMEVEYYLDGKLIGTREIADSEISLAEAKREKAKADREARNAAIRKKYGYCEDDFDVIYYINGTKYGKDKNGNLINLGHTNVKGEKLKDDNPFTRYVDTGKRHKQQPKKGLFLNDEPTDWSKQAASFDTMDLSAQINANAKKDIVIDMTNSLPPRIGSKKPEPITTPVEKQDTGPVGQVEDMSEETRKDITTKTIDIIDQMHSEERAAIHQLPIAEESEKDNHEFKQISMEFTGYTPTSDEIDKKAKEYLAYFTGQETTTASETTDSTDEEVSDTVEETATDAVTDESSDNQNTEAVNEYANDNPEDLKEIIDTITVSSPTIVAHVTEEDDIYKVAKKSMFGDIIIFRYLGASLTLLTTEHGLLILNYALPDGTQNTECPDNFSIKTFKSMCEEWFNANASNEEAEAETDNEDPENSDEHDSLRDMMFRDYSDDNVHQMTQEEIEQEREAREQAKMNNFGITNEDYIRSKDLCDIQEDPEPVPNELIDSLNNDESNTGPSDISSF